MFILIGSILIGLALGNLYFVFDAKQTMWDLVNLFAVGFCGSIGIVYLAIEIKREK